MASTCSRTSGQQPDLRQVNRRAPGKDFLGSSFAEQHSAPSDAVQHHRRSPALEREWQGCNALDPRQLGFCDSRLEAAPDRQIECVAERRPSVLEVELAAEQSLEVQIAQHAPVGPTASR